MQEKGEGLMKRPIVLGSKSKRRKEIFSTFDIPFIQDSADIDESDIDCTLTPEEYTTTLSERKGKKLLLKHPESSIITADTMVHKGDEFLGKPANKEEAIEMLRSLSGSSHVVGTSISLTRKDFLKSLYDETIVTFRDLSTSQIEKYVEAYSPYDKAGAYGIQDCGGLLIQKIEGNFHNVVGFEIKLVEKLFKKIGINLWDYLNKRSSLL